MYHKKSRTRPYEKGFTLIEILVVMVIIGMIAGVVGLRINSSIKKARVNATKAQISALEQGVSQFNLECGFYPEDLESLIRPPSSGRQCKGFPPEGFLSKKEIPKDPWQKDYSYSKPGTHNTDSYDLWSSGPDGEEGTSDDVANWATEAPAE